MRGKARRSRALVGFYLLTALARGLSAAKEVLLAAVLGTSVWKDALVIAWTVPTLASSFSTETFPALLTPRWAQRRSHPAPLLAAMAMGLMGVSAAAMLWPGVLVGWVAPGLAARPGGAATVAIAVALERWLAINVALLGGQSLVAARLNAERRFGWPPGGTCVASLCVLAALAVTRTLPLARRITWIAAGITAGNAVALALGMAAWAVRSRGVRARPEGERDANTATRGLRPLAAMTLAMLILNLVPLAERMAAAGLPAGSLAAYDYADRLVQWVFSLSVAPFTAVYFTRLSELAGQASNPRELGRDAEYGLRLLLNIAIPCGVLLAVFPRLLTRCVFGWGQFQAASLLSTAPVVAIRGGGMALEGAVYYLLFASYATGGAGEKLSVATLLAAVNVPLAFWWSARWGTEGLAAAHVFAYGVALLWLLRASAAGARWQGAAWEAARAGGLSLAPALGMRALLPEAAVAGRMGGAASCAWAVLAVSGSLALAGAAAWRWVPGVAPQARQLWAAQGVA
ncbi:MAG TPA: lipid II flippase MurJ [Terriglobales bacterium]|nr:lipid II flippase MurJ [Terriglobales bacterium]